MTTIAAWNLPVLVFGTTEDDTSQDQTLAGQFSTLAEQWRQETGDWSSLSSRIAHPAYLRIVALGRPAVPLLLQELRQRPNHWFEALHAITGANPVDPAQRGNMREMVNAWLQWGKDQGIPA